MNTAVASRSLESELKSRCHSWELRYAQCWEDADILVSAARIQPSDAVLSVCSAGDNTLALLARNPKSIMAIDMSAAQIAALELRVAAFSELSYDETLDLLGATENRSRRIELYSRIRNSLSPGSRRYFDERKQSIVNGVIDAGRFEGYFRLFRNAALPLVHSRDVVDELLKPKSQEERVDFFNRRWNTWQWRALFALFFSRRFMGLLGRESAFFKYVDGNTNVAGSILEFTKAALTIQDPANNPYLNWILKGRFGSVLPFYLNREHYPTIQYNLGKLRWKRCSLEEYLDMSADIELDVLNLSDVFEYMSQASYTKVLTAVLDRCRPGARLVYWNMLVNRQCPASLSQRVYSNRRLADDLLSLNKTFFYKRLVIEESIC